MAGTRDSQATVSITNLPAALEDAVRLRSALDSCGAADVLATLGLENPVLEEDRTKLAACGFFDIEPVGRAGGDWLVGLRHRASGVRVEMVHLPTGEASLFASGIGGLFAVMLALGPRRREASDWARLVADVGKKRQALSRVGELLGVSVDIDGWLGWMETNQASGAPIEAHEALLRLQAEPDLSNFLRIQRKLCDLDDVTLSECEVGLFSPIARFLFCESQPDAEPSKLAAYRAAALLAAVADDAGWTGNVVCHLDTGLGTSPFGGRLSIAKSVFEEGFTIADEASLVLDAWRAALSRGAAYDGLEHIKATAPLKNAGRFADAWAAGRSGWSFLRLRGGVPLELRMGMAALAAECFVDAETLARVVAYSAGPY